MKKNLIKMIITALLVSGGFVSCKKDLNLTPNYQVTSAQVYSNADGYKQSLAKVYGSMALTGNKGPSGSPDLPFGDEGKNVDFFRTYWYAQELTTDEAVCNWGDVDVPDLHYMNWSATNSYLEGLYYRSTYQIALCNDFIRQCTDANLSSRGITGAQATEIHYYAAEARFLRAYQYWVLMDLYGNPPFATDANAVGSILPKQTDRKTLFAYIESELKAIDGLLKPAKTNEYGRVDQAADWALLARLYLNAQVYTGTARYSEAVDYSSRVIKAGYTLINDYTQLMLADNDQNTSEFIWTINYDGLKTQSYGGTTFMTHAPVGGSMPATSFGLGGGWGGMRTTQSLANLFPAPVNSTFPNNGTADKRAEFWTDGQSGPNINSIGIFNDGGYGVNKYRNVKKNGTIGSSNAYSDVDFPVFRLAEMYLIYAEAVVRGGTGGSLGQALIYINLLRTRAYGGSTAGNLTSTAQITTDFILDERGRELYWECQRRTDLIRYGIFTEVTSNPRSVWAFKGGAKAGTNSQPYRNLFAIPVDDLNANPNLKQNPGY